MGVQHSVMYSQEYCYIVYKKQCISVVVFHEVHVYIHVIFLHCLLVREKSYCTCFSFLKAVSSFTISLSFPNASVLYTYFPCT